MREDVSRVNSLRTWGHERRSPLGITERGCTVLVLEKPKTQVLMPDPKMAANQDMDT